MRSIHVLGWSIILFSIKTSFAQQDSIKANKVRAGIELASGAFLGSYAHIGVNGSVYYTVNPKLWVGARIGFRQTDSGEVYPTPFKAGEDHVLKLGHQGVMTFNSRYYFTDKTFQPFMEGRIGLRNNLFSSFRMGLSTGGIAGVAVRFKHGELLHLAYNFELLNFEGTTYRTDGTGPTVYRVVHESVNVPSHGVSLSFVFR